MRRHDENPRSDPRPKRPPAHSDWDRLLGLARRSDEVEVQIETGDVSTTSLMKLAEEGGAFDFWHDDGENVYTLEDGEPV